MALRKRKTRLRKGKGGKGELENERYLGDFETIALVHMRILSGVTAQREDIKSIDLGQITCTLAYTQRLDSECHSHRLHALNEERKKEKKKKKSCREIFGGKCEREGIFEDWEICCSCGGIL